MGVPQSWRLSETLLTDLMWNYRLLGKHKEPFLLPLLSSTFQWIRVETSEISLNVFKWK